MARLPGILILAFATLLGCQDSRSPESSDTTPNTLVQAKNRGMIRIGYANEAPHAFYDPKQDRLTGEAPEIARHVFQKMGIPIIEGVLTEFGALIPGLQAKRFDVIAAGMYITPQRCREVTFSNPTYSIGEGFIIKKGNPNNLHSYEDVAQHASAQLGVVAGTVEIGYAKALGIPQTRLLIFPDALNALAGVQTGQVDAFAATSLTIQNLINKADDATIERARPFQDPIIGGKKVMGYGAFALRKEDKELLEALNQGLAEFIGTDTHLEMVRPFGFSKSELPGDVTAEEVCSPQPLPDNPSG
jgi:polar amino acid transport system substrate-binding protein